MTLEAGSAAHETADGLFSISDGRGLPSIDGWVAVEQEETEFMIDLMDTLKAS